MAGSSEGLQSVLNPASVFYLLLTSVPLSVLCMTLGSFSSL